MSLLVLVARDPGATTARLPLSGGFQSAMKILAHLVLI